MLLVAWLLINMPPSFTFPHYTSKLSVQHIYIHQTANFVRICLTLYILQQAYIWMTAKLYCIGCCRPTVMLTK